MSAKRKSRTQKRREKQPANAALVSGRKLVRYFVLIVDCLAIVCLAIVSVIPHNPIVDVIRNNPIVNRIRHNQRPSVSVTPRVNDNNKTAKPTPNGDEANNHGARLPINTAAAWRKIDDPSRDGWLCGFAA